MEFRAWNDSEKRFMVDDAIFININGESFDYTDEAMVLNGWTIEQSTRLKDKNGVEIFEGDELKLSDSLRSEYNEPLNLDNKFVIYNGEFMTFTVLSNQEIEWVEKGSNHFKYCHTNQENFYFLNQLESYEIEVVGSIHEKT